QTSSHKTRAPSPPAFKDTVTTTLKPVRSTKSLENTIISEPIQNLHSNKSQYSTVTSTKSFDYLTGPRKCILKVDRAKGLGFVLSATGDYDHTITGVEPNSSADLAGLQVSDAVLEIDDTDVTNVKYEEVVEMLVRAMRTKDQIEMKVIDSRSRDYYTEQQQNGTQDNNIVLGTLSPPTVTTQTVQSTHSALTNDNLSDVTSSIGGFDTINQQTIATSFPNLPAQLQRADLHSRTFSGSVPSVFTGITANTNGNITSQLTASEKGSTAKLSDISVQEAPVARLCRIRKFPTSPFYGFFLCGDPKKLGRVFISDVTKNSPAAVCGLRDGDRIIEINGQTTENLKYEDILEIIKQHTSEDDLQFLLLDKKSLHWYREKNYPVSSRTLPTIIHIEPIINEVPQSVKPTPVPATYTKVVGFTDRRMSKTGL
ncbi:unnamed protein product, partial [Didymodactylos carnosus]